VTFLRRRSLSRSETIRPGLSFAVENAMAAQKIILTLGLLIDNVLCVKNGLARTPQMGWVIGFLSVNSSLFNVVHIGQLELARL